MIFFIVAVISLIYIFGLIFSALFLLGRAIWRSFHKESDQAYEQRLRDNLPKVVITIYMTDVAEDEGILEQISCILDEDYDVEWDIEVYE